MTRPRRTTDTGATHEIEATARAAARAIQADAASKATGPSQHHLLERTHAIRNALVRHRTAELLLGEERPGERTVSPSEAEAKAKEGT